MVFCLDRCGHEEEITATSNLGNDNIAGEPAGSWPRGRGRGERSVKKLRPVQGGEGSQHIQGTNK